MIAVRPGVVFTTAADGDVLGRPELRDDLPVPAGWATVSQVHGDRAVRAASSGPQGEADALVTAVPRLPVAVFTADCLGIVLHGDGEVAAVHAGWRGLAAGVVENAVAAMGIVRSAVIGPHIRSCCFEVGPEVAERFPGHRSETTWGTLSVDLAGAAAERLPVEPEIVDVCTRCGSDTWSHRRDGTLARHAAVGWVA